MTSPEALARFEADPLGVVAWIASQRQGQPKEFVYRFAACVRAEARELARVKESEE